MQINFNPLPRKEGDFDGCWKSPCIYISIHSLVKRETSENLCWKPVQIYFNPLPRKEGDQRIEFSCQLAYDFNPLPRKEGDANATEYGRRYVDISIHSLVKRETATKNRQKSDGGNFNPLPRKEGDDKHPMWPDNEKHFNPLPRKEGDVLPQPGSIQLRHDFNPLPRKEGDAAQSSGLHTGVYFNPLPRKEGDDIHVYSPYLDEISIHSLVKRETNLKFYQATISPRFQSTPS